jgi:UDP-N-acetylglucosamine 2-epimerase (non-hydrolysing)
MSSAAAAIATSKMLNFKKVWKNVHIEAGLRSGSILEPFPEELSRRICDKFSDILLAVSERSKKNLENENRKGKIIKVGNTIVDSAKMAYSLVKNKFKKPGYDYALINIHRHENLKSKNRMKAIVEILKHIKITALWPIHDNTKYFLEKYGLMNEIKKITNIKIMPLVDYFTFIFLLANSKYLVTDGGSIQEESLIFKKPCVILRKRTERQEGLTTGINFLTNLDIDYAKEIIKKIENDDLKVKNFKNPYGQPGVSKKIVSMLK